MSNSAYAQPSPAAAHHLEYPQALTSSNRQAGTVARSIETQQCPGLPHVYAPMLNMILSLQSLDRCDDLPMLYAQLQSHYTALRHNAAMLGIDERSVQLAAFALVAFADETIAESNWADRTQWPFLQYDCFNTRRAGEEFFEQLQQIQGKKYDYAIWKDPAKKDLLELYYLCLLLGFRGVWAFAPPLRVQHELEQIQRHVRARPIGPLAPNAVPRAYRNVLHGTASAWMWLAIVIQVLLIAGLLLIHLR